ncbi:MAG: hypothetical protein IID48_17975 [Proteobacteria bacterium]|nr:hypothetical protein [Pseudomonadota bacterium]
MQAIAGLEHVKHGPARGLRVRDLVHRLVVMRIEGLAQGLYPDDVVLLEDRVQLRLGHLEPGHERPEVFVGLQRFGGHAAHGAAQVVDHADQVLYQRRRGVFHDVLALALAAPAQVLGLGQRAQQLVLERGELDLQPGRPIDLGRVGFGLGRLVLAIGFGVDRLGLGRVGLVFRLLLVAFRHA